MSNPHSRSGLLRELEPRRLIPNVTAGLVVGILGVAVSISFAALIFTGDLSPFLGRAIGLAFVSSIVIGMTVALFSSLPGMYAVVQDTPAVILGLAALSIAASMPAGASGRELFLTVVAANGLTTLLTACAFLALGSFRLANLVRFLPYPVVGGFLAGTGWLLVLGGLGIVTDRPLDLYTLADLVSLGAQLWVPGLALGVVLLVVTRRFTHYLVLPVTLIGAALLFYLVLLVTGDTLERWREAGLFLGPFPNERLFQPLSYTELAQVHWGLVFGQAASTATVLVLAMIALLLNATGLELATKRDVDLNRELVTAGVGNLFAGLAGGLPGYQVLSLSALNFRIGSGSRLSSLIAVGVIALALVTGVAFLAFVPKLVVGGLIIFLGLAFLVEWIYEASFKLPRLEYAVVLLILVTVATVGFLEGVGIGIVAAIVLFVISYSRTDVIKHAFDGSSYRSRVRRGSRERQLLLETGKELYALQLQGFLFFGTANALLERVKRRLAQAPPVRFVLFDFKRVTGLDATSSLSFAKLSDLARRHGFALVFTDLPPSSRAALARGGLGESEHLRIFADLDEGLEWCEEALLAGAPGSERPAEPVFEALLTPGLGAYLEKLELAPGDPLVSQGDEADALYFVETGQLTALMARGERPVRLETMQGGSVVGELGFYTGGVRTATVSADEPTTAYRLSRANLERMTVQAPELAAKVHELIVRLLADRVTHLMGVVDTLQR